MRKSIVLIFIILCTVLPQKSIAVSTVQPADTKPGYWNRPKTPENFYRYIRLRYMGPKKPGEKHQRVPLINLTPAGGALSDLTTRDNCQKVSNDLAEFLDMNRMAMTLADRLWVDWEEGIIGFENDKEYFFTRFVCLPSSTIDDLDMIGTQYQGAYVKDKDFNEYKRKNVAEGYDTILEPGDPRIHFRYDPVRFFQRFEKYGITPELIVPDTKGREGWQPKGTKATWNTTFKVLPLGDATTLDVSGETPNENNAELRKKFYNNLKYKPKTKIEPNP